MSVVILAAILPAIVLLCSQKPNAPLIKITYTAAKISICLMGTGALVIGLALTEPVLIAGMLPLPRESVSSLKYLQPSW
jgi:hypothetical protein